MTRIQLYVVNPDGVTVLLQLTNESPIKMNMSVSSLNPFAPSSYYSQSFRVPGVGPNTQFFQDVYSVNGVTFNPARSAPAWILNEGFLFSVGNLNLQAVYYNERTGLIEYECYFLGDTSDFGSEVGQSGLNTLDATELEHDISYANTTLSWNAVAGTTGGLLNGNVVYPLCDWGYTYGNTNFPEQSTVSVGFPRSFTGATAGLELSQIKPATKIKWIWDKIFEEAGYSYESEFLDSDLFGNLYLLFDSIARPEYNIPVGECTINARNFTVTTGTSRRIPYNAVISNPEQSFNTTEFFWTCPQTGTYDLSITGIGIGDVDEFGDEFQAQFIIRVFADATLLNAPVTYVSPPGFNPVSYNISISPSLVKGQQVFVTLENLSWSTNFASFQDSRFSVTNSPADVQTMNQFLPDESVMKRLDFLKSITKMFNLVFEPSKVEQKKFSIKPWNEWITGGVVRDWTAYWDGNFDFQSSAVFLDQARIVKWQGKMDEDVQNKTYQEQYKLDYAYKQFDSNIKLLKGEQTIDIGFASTPLGSIPKKTAPFYPDWVIPVLARVQPGDPTEGRSGKAEPIQPQPRILFYNGLQPTPQTWNLYTEYPGVTASAESDYPLMSPYSEWPPNEFTTLQLGFASPDPLWSTASTYDGTVQNDLYTDYWDQFTDWVYDPFNRKVNLTLRLDPLQIQEFRFNDKIWIKDSWYFINKITDYPVGQVSSVKVELVKVPEAVIPSPIPLAATGGTGGTECRRINLCNNYSPLEASSEVTYTYVDCNNNLASITIPNLTCANTICMLVPFPIPLPDEFTAADGGPCGSTGANVDVELSISGNNFFDEATSLRFYTATGGTGGPWTQTAFYSYITDNNLVIRTVIPDNEFFKIELASTLATGAAFTSSDIELFVNSSNVLTSTITTNYGLNEAIFPSAVNVLNTYGATATFIF